MPWWAAIPTAAVAVRAALLPLSAAQARSAAAFGPLLQRAREEVEEAAAAAAAADDAEEEKVAATEATAAKSREEEEEEDGLTGKDAGVNERRQQQRKAARPSRPSTASTLRCLLALRQQTSTPHPLWLVASPLLQIPVFASAVLGVRAMANAGWPGFGDGGALWFPDLTARAVEVVVSGSSSSASSSVASAAAAAVAASSSSSLASLSAPMGVAGGVLPALVAAGTLAAASAALGGGTSARGAAAAAAGTSPARSPSQEALRLLLEWLALPAFVGSLLLPQGAVLYWASSSWAALAQGAVLRSKGARELLGLREIAERAAAARSGGGGGNRGAGGASSSALLSPSMPPAALAHLSRGRQSSAPPATSKRPSEPPPPPSLPPRTRARGPGSPWASSGPRPRTGTTRSSRSGSVRGSRRKRWIG